MTTFDVTSIWWGIGAILATEVVTYINAKFLSGTVLKGYGAFFLSFVIAFVLSAVKLVLSGALTTDSLTLSTLLGTLTQVFASSEILFWSVFQKLGFDLNSLPAPVNPASTTATPPPAA